MSHVLVVDDEPGFRDVLKRILTGAGYDVRAATDAEDALRSIQETTPAIVFCDVHMPGHDGVWLANEIRRIAPFLPVVLCTSDETIPPMETLKDGLIAYVIKPFQRNQILSAAADAATWYRSKTGAAVTRTRPQLEEEQHPVPPPSTPSRRPSAMSTNTASTARNGIQFHLSSRVLVAIGVVVLLLLAAGAYWMLTRESRVLASVSAASGVIDVTTANGRRLAQGSGFFVAPNVFVTSHHVVSGAARAVVRSADGTAIDVEGVLAHDRASDLVLLKTADASTSTLAIDPRPLVLGEEVLVYGSPLGLAGTLAKGMVNADPDPDAAQFQISAPLSSGSSGSPVVDTSGLVVGVAAAVRSGGQGLGFATSARRLADLLERRGDVRPLIAASRGGGTDLDRWQLVGDVRRVTGSCTTIGHHDDFPVGAGVRIGDAERTGAADRLPTTDASCVQTLLFDRQGRLIQLERATTGTVSSTAYHYDDDGLLREEVTSVNGAPSRTWMFNRVSAQAVQATHLDGTRLLRRRIEYDDDGRLGLDQTWADDVLLQSTRWQYPDETWPSVTPMTLPATASGGRTDAMGNPLEERLAGGAVVTWRYVFDDRGNWVVKEGSVTGATSESGSRVSRRIEYW